MQSAENVMTTITATQLRNVIGSILNQVQFKGERIILQRQGKPAAALIPIEDLRLLEELEDRTDSELIERVLSDPATKYYTLDEAEALLDL
jgi:prevent-host-death family protein